MCALAYRTSRIASNCADECCVSTKGPTSFPLCYLGFCPHAQLHPIVFKAVLYSAGPALLCLILRNTARFWARNARSTRREWLLSCRTAAGWWERLMSFLWTLPCQQALATVRQITQVIGRCAVCTSAEAIPWGTAHVAPACRLDHGS